MLDSEWWKLWMPVPSDEPCEHCGSPLPLVMGKLYVCRCQLTEAEKSYML